ncbi:MAG: hypothetical protein AB1779_00040 [Candidatus Thermoplasmatota archaeon]
MYTSFYFLFDYIWTESAIIASFLLLLFGMVYPYPVMNWEKLRRFFIVIAIAYFLAIAYIAIDNMKHIESRPSYSPLYGIAFVVGLFVPIFIWLSEYKEETSEQTRMILTIFIWSYLITPLSQSVPWTVVNICNPALKGMVGWFHMLQATLAIFAVLIIFLELYRRFGRWELSEKFQLVLITTLLLFRVGYSCALVTGTYMHVFWIFLAWALSWQFLRPILLSIGLLRYQLFGTEVRVDIAMSFIFVFIFACFLFMLVLLLFGVSFGSAVVGLLIAGIGTFLIFYKGKKLIDILLPAGGKESAYSNHEKRISYLLSLQTAVIDGKIDLPEDERQLLELRKRIGISEREHELLMESFSSRATRDVTPHIEEIYLILRDGRLVAHVARRSEDENEDVIASMLTAISDFVKEGLKSQKSSLDAVRYGNFSLIIESSKEGVVLATVISGIDNPDFRQSLIDKLRFLIEKYPKILVEQWSGDLSETEEIKEYLRSFI